MLVLMMLLIIWRNKFKCCGLPSHDSQGYTDLSHATKKILASWGRCSFPVQAINQLHEGDCNARHFHYQGKNAGLRVITQQSKAFSNNDPNQSDATEP